MILGKLSIKPLFGLISVLTLLLIPACAGRHRHERRLDKTETRTETSVYNRSHESTVVPLTSEDGVWYLSVKVNDVPMRFIFDTGAAAISISTVEAEFLIKQGTLTEDDYEGTAYFSDANGVTTKNAMVNLRSVEIGGLRIKNVKACVSPNQEAPLLLGQTLLQQFGTITIDNKKGQLIIR